MSFQDLVNKIKGVGAPSGSGSGQAVKVGPDGLADQGAYSSGNISLGATETPQTQFIWSNLAGLPMYGFDLTLTVTDTTAGTVSSADTSTPIENVITSFKITANNGQDIINADGSQLDLSWWFFKLSGNKYTPSANTMTSSSTTSHAYSQTWNVFVPLKVKAGLFNLKFNWSVNTLASRLSAGTALASSTANLTISPRYKPMGPFAQLQLYNNTVQDTATGNIPFSTIYDVGRTLVGQSFQFGADADLTDVTFSKDGIVYDYNASLLQNLINKENLAFANSVPSGSQDSAGDTGHVPGFIDFQTTPFKTSASTKLLLDFASAPSVNGNSNQFRAYFAEIMQGV